MKVVYGLFGAEREGKKLNNIHVEIHIWRDESENLLISGKARPI